MYRLHETDEAIQDLNLIAFNAYKYTREKDSGLDFLQKYDETVSALELFPLGFRGISIEYRGYEVRIDPFGNYNIFFVVDEARMYVIILRVLYEKQDWNRILRGSRRYHINGDVI